MTATRFRQRKLSTKASLQVIDDSQIDAADDDTRHIAAIESGVERTEEIEHHLQAAISAANAAALGTKVKAAFIPTPDASKTIDTYKSLYRRSYSHPSSYIRFSSTVEDCSGCLYSIDEEDDVFLKQYNSKRNQGTQCSEDAFEDVTQEYESLTALKQPFLGLNDDENIPVQLLSFEEMLEAGFDDDYDFNANKFAKDLYPHWKDRRLKRHGRPLMPTLKFEQGQVDKDDGDPYVCFRRREHRPARKTRRTDAQSIEKLKRMRLEFERVKSLAQCVVQREDQKKENYMLDYKIFLTRSKLKKYKREYNIVDNDDDLVNKPRKRQAEQQAAPVPKAPSRQDGKPAEADLVQLEDLHKLRKQAMDQAVSDARRKRNQSHVGWSDQTTQIIKPRDTSSTIYQKAGPFRPVRTYYAQQLLSPPPSLSPTSSPSSPHLPSNATIKPRMVFDPAPLLRKRAAEELEEPARFRMRTGRNNRLMMDRRGLRLSSEDRETIDPRTQDRYAFDHDDSDDEEDHAPPIRSTEEICSDVLYRANLFLQSVMPQTQQREQQRRHDLLTNGQNSPIVTNLTPQTPLAPLASSPPRLLPSVS